MLAPTVFKRLLCIGSLTLHDFGFGPLWYIPIEVKGSKAWWLITTRIHNVRATLTFIDSINRSDRLTVSASPMDGVDDIMELEIDDKGKGIMVATQSGKILVPIYERDKMHKRFLGNQDIVLELYSGHTSLGRWLFKGAIINGVMQEVDP